MAVTITGGPAYGLSWNKTTDAYARYGTSSALNVPANAAAITAFNGYSPWSLMRRCNLWDDGTVTAVYGDRCYTDSDVANMGQCMVQIPKFYFYSEYDAGTTTYYWFITTDVACTIDVGLGVGAQAVKIHPAFSRDSVTKNYIYLGAYEGYLSSTLDSKAFVQPTSNKTIAQFRTAARAHAGTAANIWEIQDYLTTAAVQLLYLIEYADFDAQTNLSLGITNMTDDATHNMSSNTGHTTTLGNLSGQVLHTFDHVPDAGDLTGYAMSYRGIENFYGNINQILDGINIKADYMPWIADHDFASDTFAHPYIDSGLTCSNTTNYILDIIYTATTFDYSFLPLTTGAGTTKLCDYLTTSAGNHITAHGGRWASGAWSGMFQCNTNNLSSISDRYYGARLMYIG